MKSKKIAVLLGGGSSEREISLLSGEAVAQALQDAGYEVERVLVDTENRYTLPKAADAVFIMLHGAFGEDGMVQAQLNAIGMPYVGCGVEASRTSFDKARTRKVLEAAGVPVAKGYTIRRDSPADYEKPRLPLPLVVKATRQGSSVGVAFVLKESDWAPAVQTAFTYDEEAVVEAFIPGREVSIPVLGNGEALPVVEIVAKDDAGWYDWHAKYSDDAKTAYVFPADNPADAELMKRAQEIAVRTYHALGCRGMSRIDERITPEGEIFVLENNTIPGCTAHSILPKSAQKAGISFAQLVARLVEGARCD